MSPDADFERELLPIVPKLRAFARVLTRHAADGEDLAQAAVLKAWQARASFEPGTELVRWTYRILRNEHISRHRRARRAGEHSSDGLDQLVAYENLQALFELDEIRRALSELPFTAREAIVLVGAGGLSYEHAAELAGCPVGTMKTRVFRARATLAQRLTTSVRLPKDARSARDALDLILQLVPSFKGGGAGLQGDD